MATKKKMFDFSKMDLKERIVTAAKVIVGMREQVPIGATVSRPEDSGWRRLSQKSDKELSTSTWQKQMLVGHYLWMQNPMAYRILELTGDFVVGDGFTWTAKDEEVKKILARHWDDPDNAWDLLQHDRYVEMILFGTFCHMAFVNPHNGHVKISPIDPSRIKEIVPDPEIAGKAIQVKITSNVGDSTGKAYNVVHQVNAPEDPMYGRLQGEVFYRAINRLTFTLQGIGDLYRVADWLDAFDQFIFSLLERISFLNAHLYDITLEDAEKEEIDLKAGELEMNPPKPGGFRVHNQKEKWEALAPKINAAEIEQVAKIVKTLVLGSLGIPEHWFGEGGDVNLATAVAMDGPIHRRLKRKQSQWVAIVREVLQFQIDQAVKAKRLTLTTADGKPRDLSFEVIPPDVSAKDIGAFATTLSSLVDAMSKAVAEKFILRSKASEIVAAQASESGVEVKPATEDELAGQATKDREEAETALSAAEAEVYAGTPARGGKKKPVSDEEPEPAPGPEAEPKKKAVAAAVHGGPA